MPTIELRNNWADGIHLLSVMCFPNDAKMRTAYYARTVARRIADESAGNEYAEISVELLNELISAPGREQILSAAAQGTKRGTVAGDFLQTLYFMNMFPNIWREPSYEKAYFACREFAKSSKYGDGSKIPISPKIIREYIEEFRSVAHLWAAYRINQEFNPEEHPTIFASAEGVGRFVRIAGGIQKFACEFSPKRVNKRTPFLDREHIWQVPPGGEYLKLDLREPPSRLVQILSGYKAKKREVT